MQLQLTLLIFGILLTAPASWAKEFSRSTRIHTAGGGLSLTWAETHKFLCTLNPSEPPKVKLDPSYFDGREGLGFFKKGKEYELVRVIGVQTESYDYVVAKKGGFLLGPFIQLHKFLSGNKWTFESESLVLKDEEGNAHSVNPEWVQYTKFNTVRPEDCYTTDYDYDPREVSTLPTKRFWQSYFDAGKGPNYRSAY